VSIQFGVLSFESVAIFDVSGPLCLDSRIFFKAHVLFVQLRDVVLHLAIQLLQMAVLSH